MRERFVKCVLDAKFYNEKQDRFRMIARNAGLQYEPKPVEVHYLGNIYLFKPECEVPEKVGEVLNQKRWYIKTVGEPYEKCEESAIPTDAQEEDEHKFGMVYLCKYCGWPFPKVNSRNIHERRWCKRKDN